MDASSNDFQKVFKAVLAKNPCNCKQIRPDQIPDSKNVPKHFINHLRCFKVKRNYFEKVHWNEITLKGDVQTIFIRRKYSRELIRATEHVF